MALLKIYDVNQPCLRARCHRITRVTSADRRLLDDMTQTMDSANGIGLAAPQVGVLKRMIVVSVDEELYQLINPEVTSRSEEVEIAEEGCLSLPNYYGPVERPARVTVRALDPHGKKLKIRAEGLLARCLQHEIDHLDGILFFDPSRMLSLTDLKYSDPAAREQPDQEGDRSADSKESAERMMSKSSVTANNETSPPSPIQFDVSIPSESIAEPAGV